MVWVCEVCGRTLENAHVPTKHKCEINGLGDPRKETLSDHNELTKDGQRLVEELGNVGVTIESDLTKIEGLGDLIHATLNKIGITEERFKQVLQLKECNCNARRKFLNKLIPFTKG